MSQLALEIRSLVSERKGLHDCVGVCDDFLPHTDTVSLKAHLKKFTQEDEPLLGNPKHPQLLFDECEQLIIPMCFREHAAVLVVKLSVADGKRKAFIQYFDGTGRDLADDILVSIGAFFTENHYEVLYHCVSETIVKDGITNAKITCFKAVDLANRNANIEENLVATLDESKETPAPQAPPAKKLTKGFSWLLIVLASGCAIYMGFDYLRPYIIVGMGYLQPYNLALMAMIPANPLLAFIACGGVFCTGWLVVSCLQYLTREREAPKLKSVTKSVGIVSDEQALPQKTFLNAFDRCNDNVGLQTEDQNKKATACKRSLRLN